MLPAESRPSPWLTFLLPMLLGVVSSVATTTFTAGQRSAEVAAELRQCKELNAAQDARIKALEDRAHSSDLTLERFHVELKHIREGVDDLRAMLRGGSARR